MKVKNHWAKIKLKNKIGKKTTITHRQAIESEKKS